ncbi:MAG TPA: ABC transporter ATP-binding protein [Glycomyces sp.]|nr:ABC transporter ATP-binding protein [Glycomyces sp.]
MKQLRKYARLHAELLATSMRIEPQITLIMIAGMVFGACTFALTAVGVKITVDAMADGDTTMAIIGGAAAAAAYSLDWVIGALTGVMTKMLIDKAGHTGIEPVVMRNAAGIPDVDHLEHAEFLDRMTALRGQSWAVIWGFTLVVRALAQLLRLILAVALLGSVSPWLLLMFPCVAIQLWLDKRGQARERRADLALAEDKRVQDHLFDLCISGAAGKEIRATGAGPELIERHNAAADRVRSTRLRGQLSGGVWRAAGWVVFAIGYTVSIGFVAPQVGRGEASVGDVMMAATIGALLRDVVGQAVSTATNATGTVRVLQPYLWLREYASQREDTEARTQAPTRVDHGVSLKNLTYTYRGTDIPAVDDLSVDIPAGSVVAVVGEYGSGKTTLMKLLAKLHRPTSGTIQVDGVDLASIDTEQWRQAMSAAFQDFGRYETTFAEAITIGDLERGDAAALDAAVAAANAEDLRERLPDGDQTQLGTKFGGVALSEGQWQKVALARSCMRAEPLLFLLDEPTASLDAPSEQAVFDSYMARSKQIAAATGSITVIVSHRFSTVAGADLILVMKHGRLIESGGHKELMAADGSYADLYGIHATSYS